MTIGELMKRVAGEDLEWADLDNDMVRDMADEKVQMGMLTGVGKDSRPFLFRLPIEKLRKKP
jgi:hypothetical protein